MTQQFWTDGRWTDQPPRLIGPADHAFWQGSVVFDGARAFGRCAPDLDLHCRRIVASAEAFGMRPTLTAEEIHALAVEGIGRFPADAVLYVKPLFYGAGGLIGMETATTTFALHLFAAPWPGAHGFSATMSPLRRPAPEMAPTDAKAACLYPNSDRATREAVGRGFDAAVLRDPWDNIAEFAFANIMIARDGVVRTPRPNGTFLAGITRRRVLVLLREAGIEAVEDAITETDLHNADEIFSVGNYGKVVPCVRYEDRALPIGPIFREAKQRYFEWADETRVG